MAICHFCQRIFHSSQAVRAHLRRCERYHAARQTGLNTLGTMPRQALPKAPRRTTSRPSSAADHAPGAQDPFAPFHDFVKTLSQPQEKPPSQASPQQRRRKILQTAKAQVIDHYRTPLGEVTPAMRGAAKSAIERELAALPLEELPFEEVCELAVTIREQCYLPVFKRQAEEAEHQKAEHEARRRRETEAAAVAHRAERRKTTLIEQAIDQARAICEATSIVGWNRLGVLVNIESRLHEFLTGHESVPEAHAIIQTVLNARFAEAEAKQDAAQAKKDDKWREEMTALLVLGALAGLVVLALKFPAYTLAILDWIGRTFGFTPGTEAGAPNPGASETAPSAANTESKPPSGRRRTSPPSPLSPELFSGNPVGPEQGQRQAN